jgi:L-lactate utilization protein LutB
LIIFFAAADIKYKWRILGMKGIIKQTIKALQKHGFEAKYIPSKKQAIKLLLREIPKNAVVGIPGSKSVRELSLDNALRTRGNVVYDHWVKNLSPEQSLKIRKAQLTCDVLITSANAITATGEIYNMDGIGNRVSATIFGPERVIFVAGLNKLVFDLESARERVKKIAAPKRAQELKIKVPCVKKGECTDCNSRERICRAEVILHRPPSLTKIEVYIIGEELGN